MSIFEKSREDTGVEEISQSARTTCRRISSLLHSVFILYASLSCFSVWSAAWEGSGGANFELQVVETSSTGTGDPKQASLLTVEPFYRFRRANRAHTLNGRLGIRHQRFSGGGGQSTTPSLALGSRVTLIEQGLWFSSSATATSRSISTTGFLDDVPTSNERTDTFLQFQLGPELSYQASDRVRMSARATFARSQIVGEEVSVSQANTSLGVESGLLWALDNRGNLISLDGRIQETEFDEVFGQARIASVSIGGVTPLSRRFFVYVRAGYDWLQIAEQISVELDDEIDVIEGEIDTSGGQYAIGARWQPNRRMEFNAEYAERAFGYQPSVSVLLNGRHTQLELKWSRDLQLTQLLDTTIRGLQPLESNTDEQISAEENDGEGQIPDASCDTTQSAGCVVTPFIFDSRSINETISATYTLTGRKSSLVFSVTRTELDTLNGGSRRHSDSAELLLKRSLYKNLTTSLSCRISNSQADSKDNLSIDSRSVRASLIWVSR